MSLSLSSHSPLISLVILCMLTNTSTVNMMMTSKFASLTHFSQLSSNLKFNSLHGILFWMSQRCVKCNMSKTEIMIFLSKPAAFPPYFLVYDLTVYQKPGSHLWYLHLSHLSHLIIVNTPCKCLLNCPLLFISNGKNSVQTNMVANVDDSNSPLTDTPAPTPVL